MRYYSVTRKGFTLIELLIVIALLGALAVGLIGAIDPFEQLKKGTDTGTRDIVSQIQTAVIRYYSVKNEFPWVNDPSSQNLSGPDMIVAISAMVGAGELKSEFTTLQANNLTKVFVTGDSNPSVNTVKVCYMPQSKSFQADPNTKYLIDGEDGTNCKSTGGSLKCYWCIQ